MSARNTPASAMCEAPMASSFSLTLMARPTPYSVISVPRTISP